MSPSQNQHLHPSILTPLRLCNCACMLKAFPLTSNANYLVPFMSRLTFLLVSTMFFRNWNWSFLISLDSSTSAPPSLSISTFPSKAMLPIFSRSAESFRVASLPLLRRLNLRANLYRLSKALSHSKYCLRSLLSRGHLRVGSMTPSQKSIPRMLFCSMGILKTFLMSPSSCNTCMNLKFSCLLRLKVRSQDLGLASVRNWKKSSLLVKEMMARSCSHLKVMVSRKYLASIIMRMALGLSMWILMLPWGSSSDGLSTNRHSTELLSQKVDIFLNSSTNSSNLSPLTLNSNLILICADKQTTFSSTKTGAKNWVSHRCYLLQVAEQYYFHFLRWRREIC